MNSAKYVDELVDELRTIDIPVSDKMWQTGLACVGMSYVFGAWGALCTPAERKKRYGYNPSHTTILSSCQVLRSDNPKGSCKGCKWFPNEERTRCWDCRGFEEWLYEQFGIDLEGQGATSQWNSKKNWCVKSDDMSAIPQNVIVSVFIKKDGSMSHTGFYLNGETLECSNGVQHFAPMKKNRWTHWAVSYALANDLNKETKPADPPAEDDTQVFPVLKKGDKGEKVKELQKKLLALGYKLPKYGADGSFGNETKSAVEKFQRDWGIPVSGIVDEQTWERLLTAPEKPIFYTVTITRLLEEQADEIIAKYGGTKTAEG